MSGAHVSDPRRPGSSPALTPGKAPVAFTVASSPGLPPPVYRPQSQLVQRRLIQAKPNPPRFAPPPPVQARPLPAQPAQVLRPGAPPVYRPNLPQPLGGQMAVQRMVAGGSPPARPGQLAPSKTARVTPSAPPLIQPRQPIQPFQPRTNPLPGPLPRQAAIKPHLPGLASLSAGSPGPLPAPGFFPVVPVIQRAPAMPAAPDVIQCGIAKVHLHRRASKRTLASRVTFTGRWTKKITVSGARSYRNERNRQLLKHLSVQLFHYVRTQLGMTSEQEIQAMHVNDRIVIAANDEATLTAFYNDLARKATEYAEEQEEFEDNLANQLATYDDAPVHPLESILTEPQATDQRTVEHAQKLRGVLDLNRLFLNESNTEALDTLRGITWTEEFVGRIDATSEADCKLKLTNPAYLNKILVLKGVPSLHAEQKLVVALWRSGVKSPVVIQGKKRPCAACDASLTFARQKLRLNITFNPNPGGYWSTSNTGLQMIINFGIDAGLLTKEQAMKWVNKHYKHQNLYQTRLLSTTRHRTKLKTIKYKHTNKANIVHETGNASDSDSEPEDF